MGYKSLEMADAIQRVSQQLAPKVSIGTLENSVYRNNTNTPDATANTIKDLNQANKQYQSLYNKTGGDYAQDAAVALGKGIVAVPQAAAGLVDLLDAGAQGLMTLGTDDKVQGGRFTKALEDHAGVRFKETQDIMAGWYSDGTQKQLQQLAALPGTSMDKSLGENLSSIGDTASYLLDNPALALNTIVESLPQIAAGGVVGRGAAALGGKVAAGAIGEGTIMAGAAQANMDRGADGYTTGNQALGALAIGVGGGLIGQLGGRIAHRAGADDINQLAAGQVANTANKGYRSLGVGTATEAVEEAAQSSLENVVTNISSGKDAIAGLNQDLVLGTFAGAGMGAAANARSSISTSALNAVRDLAQKQMDRISKAAPERTETPTEDFTNPRSESYNPTAAIIRAGQSYTQDQSPENVTKVREEVNQVMEDAETHLATLQAIQDGLSNIDMLRQNIGRGEAAIAKNAETNPDKAAQITTVVDGLKDQLETLTAYEGQEQALTDAISHQQDLVNDARVMHDQYSSILGNAEVEGATTDSKIFGAPTAYTSAQLEQAMADPSISDISKVALRALSDAIVAQNAVKDLDAVNQQVMGKSLDENYISTPQYLDNFGSAIQRGSVNAQNNLLQQIGAFEQSHVPKAELAASAFQFANRLGKAVQIINADGQWVVNRDKFLTGKEARANGALVIHPAKNGKKGSEELVNYMQAEAQAITATRTAMEAMRDANTNTPNAGITEPSTVSAPSNPQAPETLTQQGTVESDPMQSALDDLNQNARDNYDWQSDRRSEDPRSSGTPITSNPVGQTEASVPAEVQPASRAESNTAPTKAPTKPKPTSVPEQAPSLKDTTITFDENGVGSVTPAKTERVASRSESADVATEAQASTEKAIQETQDTSTDAQPEQVVVADTKPEPQPQDINTAEKADKNPERTAERAKEPNKRNLVVDGFNKKGTVLNLNENFMSRFMNRDNNKSMAKELTGEDVNPKQAQAINDFVKFNEFMSKKLDGMIAERKGITAKGNDYADFRYQDFNQFLLEDGSLPENVKTAVSASIFNWIAENGSKTINSEKDVANLLFLTNVESIDTSVYSDLYKIGDHQAMITNSLGQKAVAALGLKTVSDVDPARKAKLEMGLGTLAAVAMVQNGYLERTTLNKDTFAVYQVNAYGSNEYAKVDAETGEKIASQGTLSFLRPTTQQDGIEPSLKVSQIIDSARETKGIVGKLFDIPSDRKLPATEPVTAIPNTFNRMGSPLPTMTQEVFKTAQGYAYKMSAPAMQFMDKVSRDDLKKLFGYKTPNADGSFDGMHKKFWEGTEAANQALERSLDTIAEQRANLDKDDQSFYFEHTSQTQQRSGYDAAFNLQANKVHRAVAGMADHVTEVGIEATHKNGETTKFGEFLMAVAMTAEEIDIGLPTVDKVSSETYLPAFQEYLNQEHVQAGIASMASILETKSTAEDIANVQQLVNEFGMGPMSVRGIQALAQMYIAERDGARTFTSDIAFESDGVTNGPVITNVALNTADADMLEAGGVFTDKALTNVPSNKESGSKDIYEQLGEVMLQAWEDYKKTLKPHALNTARSLDLIYQAFGARKGAKPIVTTSNYGAGMGSINRANAREVLDAFYKGLEKAGNKNDLAQAQLLVTALNNAIGYANFRDNTNVPLATAQGNILEFMLTPAQEKALMSASIHMHGQAINTTLNTAMADFQKVRDTLTVNANAGFAAYEIVRKAALDEAMKDTTGVLVDSKGNRQEGLTSDQMKAALKSIAKYTPSVVSGMGNMSTNGKQSSIPLMKQETTWDGSAMSSQEFGFTGSWDKKGGKTFRVNSTIKRDSVANPGVSGLALIIQSIDAMIAHSTLGAMPVQNYHDANASVVGEGKAMARVQNEAFVDGLMNTHVNREFIRAAMKPMQAFLDNPALATKDNIKALKEAVIDMSSFTAEVKNAYARDMAKLDGMKSWENVNQYGTQGGHFVMTDAKRSEIVKAVDKLKADMKADLKQADAIDGLLYDFKGAPKTIQATLEADGTMTGKDLVPMLQEELKQFKEDKGTKGKFSKFYDSMLDLITDRMPAGLEVNYFHAVEEPANVSGLEEALANKNPAWFTTGKDGKPQINILRSDAPIKAQVLVHELVHAITVDSIAQVRNEPTAHPKAAESLAKLDALYEHVKAQVKADPNATDLMKYATQNVEEFVATGFSYPEFVNYLDNQLAPKAARGKNRIVTALRAFVDSIMGVLESFTGRKYSAKDATALEALILDTAEFLGRTNPPVAGTQSTIFGAPTQARSTVDSYSSKQVFDALNSNLDPAFKAHLRSMMINVSDTIYNGLETNMITNPDGTWSPEKAWEEYVDAGNAMTTETATTAGFRMTDQESFAVESLYAALQHGLKDKSMTQVFAEMDKSFKSARAKLKPQNFHDGDWNTATPDEKADAQDMHDFVFKLGASNPDHIARFVAMAIGSQQFNNLLGFTVRDTDATPNNAFERIVEGTNSALDYVYGLMTNSSSSQQIKNRLGLLSKELARIDEKNRNIAITKVEQQLEKLADYTDDVSNSVRDQVVKLADHDAIANSRFTAVRLASNVTRLSAKGDLWTTLDVIKEGLSVDNPNQRLGLVGEIINEAANNDATKNGVEKMLRLTKLNNQMKENIRDTTRKNVMSTFEENGAYLTKEDKASITTFMRADTQALAGNYSTAEIARMYSDANFLNKEIRNLAGQINDVVLVNQAKKLAKYMITGLSSDGMQKNAHLIVSGFNSTELAPANDPRIDLVDRIASMYAIQYTDSKEKNRINAIAKRELKNKVNGLDTVVKFHKELAQVAKDTLFVDNVASVTKGYVPEITNPNRDIRIAKSDAEAQLLKDQFYKEVKTVGRDAKDPRNLDARVFLTEEANIQRLVSGVIEVVSTNRKGSQVFMDYIERMALTNAVANSVTGNTNPNYNPMADTKVYLTPNYDTKGHILGYSYEMSGRTRDNLLERNNDFSELLGAYAATNFNKVTVPEQNNKVIDAAHEDYKANFASNPRAYVTVGPNSNDVGLREVWAMLPDNTRQHITSTWGKDGMLVRNDVLLSMFGYRKYSLNQSFDKMDEAKSTFEKLYTNIMSELFGSNAKVKGVRAERAWQESVRLMKDIIVIRNVKTMVANIMSNTMLLMAHGANPSDIMKDTMLSVRAGIQYRKDTALLMAARQKQRAGVGDFNQLEQEALKYEDALARNPLASFIEEGMMPTIVEDVDPDTNHYSYKSKLQQRVDDATSAVPQSVKTAAKWAFVSPDTPLYQFLNNATQFSDFSAKYVMYQYYTKKAKEKLSHDEALQIASDNFVNYDVPTAKGLQYLNDMGVVMFTKYNIRIQKALFQLMKKRPAAVMAQAMFINSFTNLEAGIDPLIWFNMGNPMRSGAIGLPSALDEPLPIKMLTGMF